MYSVLVYLGCTDICEIRLKSITQVCKFLDTVNFKLVTVDVISPKGKVIDVNHLIEVWHA